MKKLICLLLCLLCFAACCISASAEPMVLWDGLTFGMTGEEVAAAQTMEVQDSAAWTYGPGTILDIINSTVTFGFENGVLTDVRVEFPAKKSSTLIRGDYDTVHAALKKAYGKKLGRKSAKEINLHGAAWTQQLENKEQFKAAGGKTQHEEWIVETDGGRVLVEHFCVYIAGRTTASRHTVEYMFLPSEPEQQAAENAE